MFSVLIHQLTQNVRRHVTLDQKFEFVDEFDIINPYIVDSKYFKRIVLSLLKITPNKISLFIINLVKASTYVVVCVILLFYLTSLLGLF